MSELKKQRRQRRSRAITVDQLSKKRFTTFNFQGQWKDAFGMPEQTGIWIIWGNSGNGKTRFCLQLAKYMASFCKVAYNTLEEGARRSFQKGIEETRMVDVKRRFLILDREPIEELKERLKGRQSPKVIIIDSLQYTGMDRQQYIELKEAFPNKMFVFISHAEGKNPAGRTANFARYDADVKIRVEGYRAFPVSRYGGGEPFTIWDEGASKYWIDKE
ncbi:hypothetical protein [Flammeovirga sp. OC4]|uniref:hypothetical protein n=1 Tax=Flammeovirga sp. OC4 TaxID=1382345 RepID=UPI0005C6C37E|nr:hypothetical protein [Flammeovirga sp. OC4]